MLENEFFPTPVHVIKRMLKRYIRESSRYGSGRLSSDLHRPILDPSAGAGDILDYLSDPEPDRFRPEEKAKAGLGVHKRDLLACELSQELRYVLQGKEYRIIGTDWLEYNEPITVGTIVMNPPFSEGDKHVLHSWRFLEPLGTCIALLNAETIRNPHTSTRENLIHLLATQVGIFDFDFDAEDFDDRFADLLVKLEAENVIEWFGSCFKNAERPTDVEVVCIWLKKPKASPSSYGFDGMELETDEQAHADHPKENQEEQWASNPLALTDALKDLVARYEAARKMLLARDEIQKRLDFFTDGLENSLYAYTPDYGQKERDREGCLSQKESLNDQLALLKARAWATVFKKTKLGTRTTSDFQKKFTKFSQSQMAMAFTEANVRELLEMFFQNREQIMQDAIVHTFDEATAYHEKNKIHNEGWKTNKSYRCNKRIIIPYGVDSSYGMWRPYDRVRDFLNDLDKIMCFLSGKSQDHITCSYSVLYDFLRRCDGDYQHPIESTFFKMRGFKKGTLHIDFKDLDLLAAFNQAAAKGKKWMGDGS